MKPLELELYGFGAFAEACNISFEAWQNGEVFLITGETGSGKTTIFDAICFALYGTASGSDRDSKQFRSQYLTDSKAETKVRLKFSCNGKCYLVERNPAYERQKQRGIGTVEQKADAVLYEILPDGRNCICSGVTPVTGETVRLIGMDSKQFRQIVMIAQGEFRRFLLSNSVEKSEILSKLFHTEYCQSIREGLKQCCDAKKQEVDAQKFAIQTKLKSVAPWDAVRKQFYQEQLEKEGAAVSEALCDLLEADYTENIEQLPKLEQKQVVLQQKIDHLVQCIAQGKQHNANRSALERQQKQLTMLQQKQALAQELVQRTEEQATQIPIWQEERTLLESSVSEYQHMAELQDILSELQKKYSLRQQEQVRCKATLEQTKQQCTFLQKALEEHAALAAACETVRHTIVQKQQVLGTLQGLQTQFIQVQEAEQLCQQFALSAQAAHTKYYQVEKPAYEAIEQQFFQSMAGNLAAQLVPEEPCPVCGAIEHPHPAARTEQTVTEQQFQRARKQQEVALRDMQQQKSQLEKQQALCVQLQTQKQAALQQQKLKETTTLELLKKLEEKIQAEIKAFLQQQTEQQDKLRELEKKQAEWKRKQEALPILQNAYEAGERDVQELAQQISGRRAELTCARSTLQYATLQEAQEQLQCLQQKIEQAQQRQKQVQTQQQELEKQVAVCQTDLLRLQTEVAGKPLYDVQQAEQVVQESRRMLSQQQKQIAVRKADLQQMQMVFTSVRLKTKKMEETQIVWQEYKELYSMLNGTSTDRGGERISFERYVQTYYFTRILEHANQKLYQLSNGRYQLIRRKEEERRNLSSGLNLDVLDQYTGRERDVKTLSGGETFLASLSLALGLSEAVQQQSGCVQIQAMFIDEGFGSLDETALENAIRLLQQLSGQNCMVGIISHVPALAERFDAQIRVEKTPNGSRAVCVGMKK